MERINHDGAQKHLKEGRRMLEPGPEQNLELAIAEFSKAIFLLDTDPEFFEARGEAYLLLRDYKTAVSNFRQALKLDPDNAGELSRKCSNLLSAQGLSRLKAREFEDALHLFSSAIQTDPSNIYVHVHRALAFIGQGKIPDALDGLQQYLDQETSSPQSRLVIHILVARLHKQIKNPTKAATHVQQALKIQPSSEEALKLYAQLKGRAGELYNEATDLLLKNEPQRAIDCLCHAIELDATDARFLIRRGVIHRQLGSYNEAVADLEKVLEMTNRTNGDALRQLAITYNQLAIELYAAKDFAQALTVYDLALRHDDQAASVWVNRGDCHREVQEVGLALQDYLKAHELNPGDKETRIRLSTLYDARGLTYFDRGLLLEAEAEFSSAIKYLPQVPHYYMHRATTCMESANHKQALLDYKKVVELDPGNEQAWARLTMLGDTATARHGPALEPSLPRISQHRRAGAREPARRGGLGRARGRERGEGGEAGRGEGGGEAAWGGKGGSAGGEGGLARPAPRARRDVSPTKQSKAERNFFRALAGRKIESQQGLRSEIAYKSDRRLDTSMIDDKYRDPATGLPISTVKGLKNPYPTPSLR